MLILLVFVSLNASQEHNTDFVFGLPILGFLVLVRNVTGGKLFVLKAF